jgi:hypothetical protein
MLGSGLFEKDVDVTGNDIRTSSDTMSGKFLHLMGIGNIDNTRSPHVLELSAKGLLPSNTNSNSAFGVAMTSNEFKDGAKAMYHGKANAAQGLDLLVTSYAYRGATYGQQKEMLRRSMDIYKNYMKTTTYATSERIQNERYAKELFKLVNDTEFVEVNPEDPDYIKNVRTEAELRSADNKVALQKFKKELNIK